MVVILIVGIKLAINLNTWIDKSGEQLIADYMLYK